MVRGHTYTGVCAPVSSRALPAYLGIFKIKSVYTRPGSHELITTLPPPPPERDTSPPLPLASASIEASANIFASPYM